MRKVWGGDCEYGRGGECRLFYVCKSKHTKESDAGGQDMISQVLMKGDSKIS